MTVSGEVRLIKPDPAIYAHHAEAFGLTPGRDALLRRFAGEYRGGARAAGWNAELFTDVEKLRDDLERYGIDCASDASTRPFA